MTSSFLPRAPWRLGLLAGVLSIAMAQACGGNVVVDGSSGAGGTSTGSATGGAGGGPSDACLSDFGGPVDPNACLTDGATCSNGGIECAQLWTCQGGTWSMMMVCGDGSTSSSGGGG